MNQDKQRKQMWTFGSPFTRLVMLAFIFFAVRPLLYGDEGWDMVTMPNVTVYSMGGDLVWRASPVDPNPCRISSLVYDGKIQCLVDIRTAKTLDAIVIKNGIHAATLSNCYSADILVASDEHAPGFNRFDVASYTELVFSGSVLPLDYWVGIVREAVLNVRLKRRYYLIQHTRSFWGAVEDEGNPNSFEVLCHDISYRLVPASGTVVIVQ